MAICVQGRCEERCACKGLSIALGRGRHLVLPTPWRRCTVLALGETDQSLDALRDRRLYEDNVWDRSVAYPTGNIRWRRQDLYFTF